MSPIIFEVGPLQVRWYGLLFAMAVLTGTVITTKMGERFGLDPEALERYIIRLILTIIVGARLGFVLINWEYYIRNPLEILYIHRGGLGSHGGILLGFFMSILYTRSLSLPFWRTADAVALVIPVSHIFIRLGNFINGELYGPPTDLPWGVVFPGTTIPHHPSQLYELVASLLVLPLIYYFAKHRPFDGYLFLVVLTLQSTIRLFIDFTRQSTPLIFGPFILTQVISILLIIMGGIILYYKKKGLSS